VKTKTDIKYTGYEIVNRYKLLQRFVADYDVDNWGPILDNKVSIYNVNKNQCVMALLHKGVGKVWFSNIISEWISLHLKPIVQRIGLLGLLTTKLWWIEGISRTGLILLPNGMRH